MLHLHVFACLHSCAFVSLLANCYVDNDSKSNFQHKFQFLHYFHNVILTLKLEPGRVVQSVGHLTRKSGVLGSIPGLATYCRFSFRFFKKGSCQLLAKVCARSTG